jgi:hypothetical protein
MEMVVFHHLMELLDQLQDVGLLVVVEEVGEPIPLLVVVLVVLVEVVMVV